MSDIKPIRDYKKTLLSMVNHSIGSNIFRNFWVSTPERGEFDSLDDGENSCAFYVSSLLVILGLAEAAHGTVSSTIKDLEVNGWQVVKEPQPGDIILWTPVEPNVDKLHQHVGFYVGDSSCVSNQWRSKSPQMHDLNYDNRRVVDAIYRCNNWNRLDESREL